MEIYTIKKHYHYAKRNGKRIGIFPEFEGNRMGYFFRFEKGLEYDLDDPVQQLDWNKLPGLTGCSVLHHYSSCRGGWRWNLETGKGELLAYIYDKGERLKEWDYPELLLRKDLEPKRWYGYMAIAEKDRWKIMYCDVKDPYREEVPTREDIVDPMSISIPRESCGPNIPVRFRLNPYHGGNLPAKEDVELWVEYIRGGYDFD